jgi:hypothetical protein
VLPGAPERARDDSLRPGPAWPHTGPVLVASGTDYTVATLAQLSRAAALVTADPDVPRIADRRLVLPAPLRDAAEQKVADPSELTECLAAVTATYQGVPSVVDYARFGGAPALVIVLWNRPVTTVVAVGPDCGSRDLDLIAVNTAQ